jgi:YidC/Oxa1 family membrane protein insertase
MERRVLLAISLSFVVLFLFQSLVPPPPETVPPAGQAAGTAAPVSPASPGMPSGATASTVTAAPPAAAVPALKADDREREYVVTTADVEAVFTNRGGRLRHWRLRAYRDAAGAVLDLVPATDGAVLPFSLSTADAAQTARLNESLFQVESVAPERIDATTSPAVLTFIYEGADGLRVRKQFAFEPTGYGVTFTPEVTQGGAAVNPVMHWGPGLGDEIARNAGSGGMFSGTYIYPAEGFVHRDGEVTRFASTAAATAGSQQGPFHYFGVNDHYFVAAVVEPPGSQRVEFAYVPLPEAANPATVRQLVSFSAAFDTPPSSLRFFVGPKQFEALRQVNPEFTKVINFGMFAILAVPLLGALQWVNGFVGNYGWAIVILTILINVVMWPLRHKSVVSMRRMQELQPQLKAIQDRYSHLKMTDPARQKMNEEVMGLYKAKGVNPASGCVPMLLTLPVLFAFYSLLSQAIEIRGAPFAGWITDLSQHDPWYITPLLMGVTMLWQQRLQPGTGDPVQQKVLMFMPVMFTVMFLWAPSGLVIYWFVSNLWAIGQQYFTNWLIGPAKVPAAAGGKR